MATEGVACLGAAAWTRVSEVLSMKRRYIWNLVAILLAASVVSGTLVREGIAAARVQGRVAPEPFPYSSRYPAEVTLASADDLATLVRLEIDIGHVRTEYEFLPYPDLEEPFETLVATVYVNEDEVALLAAEGLVAIPIPNESLRAWKTYGPGTGGPEAWPSFEDFVDRMEGIAATHPDLVRMVSIGQSVLGHEIWMLKISDNPDLEEDEPEFKYTSTVHGNEAVGTEMTLRLAELLTQSYGSDPELTALVDEMEIWLCPIHNPDGYVAGSRFNAHGIDLNRDFPDRITEPIDDPSGREPETQAFMYFGYEHRFVMGANYHTGALVVNYPWDSVPSPPDYAPDDALFYEYSVGYASRNPMIWNAGWPGPVTRGWEWYIIRGGMQDWAYHWRGEHHVTIENSYSQPPPYNQMDAYWDAERPAMVWWMGRALEGVRGLVTDGVTGLPLDASVDLVEIGKEVRTDPDVGDYHRLALPGTYTVLCRAEGYEDQLWAVEVAEGSATVQHCPMGAPTMHVEAIKLKYQERVPGGIVVMGALRILDEAGMPVPEAVVRIQWTLPGGAVMEQQAMTTARGLSRYRVKSILPGSYELCVTDVMRDGLLYYPYENGQTCGTVEVP